MDTADQLLELIFSWIEQRELCAEKLRKFARELESLREICNGGECVGSSVSVLGTACLLGAGVATLLTGGAAAPLLGVLGGAYTGAGLTISLATKLTEHFKSSNTMTEAQKIEEKSNEIGETIQRLFHKLKAESSSTDPDEQDQHVMTEIVKAMARRSGLRLSINISAFRNGLRGARGILLAYGGIIARDILLVMNEVAGVLICFSYQATGKTSKLLFAKGAEQLAKKVASGFKTFLKGGGMVVGGAVGMAFALSEAIDNWKDLIKNNHVTEASQSLRDTADRILEMTRTLKEQLDNIKRILEEMEKHQQEENITKKQEEEKLSEENVKKQKLMENLSRKNTQQEKENDQNEQTDEEDEGKQTGKKVVVMIKTRKSDRSNQVPPGSIRVGLHNVCSLRRRTEQTRELMRHFDLDVHLLNETWLKRKGGDQVLKGLMEGFSFFRRARVTNTECVTAKGKSKGGGVATLYSNVLRGERVYQTRNPQTFEYVAAELQHDEWGQPVLSIIVYRPPGFTQFHRFLEEFQSLLDEVSEDYNSILITGDFNIHVDGETMSPTTKFLQLLQENNLVQHVEEPTHQSGHTLDLVITRNVEISGLTVIPNGEIRVTGEKKSDHYPVIFNAKPKEEKTDEEENTKRYKKTEE